jgi:hypothetical protein
MNSWHQVLPGEPVRKVKAPVTGTAAPPAAVPPSAPELPTSPVVPSVLPGVGMFPAPHVCPTRCCGCSPCRCFAPHARPWVSTTWPSTGQVFKFDPSMTVTYNS